MRPRVQSWWALAVALSPAAGAAPAVGFFKPDNVRRGVYFYNTHGACLGLHVYNHDSMEVRRACLAREQGGEAAVFALPPMAPPPPPSVVLQGEAYFRKHQHCDGLDSGDPNLPIVVVERERRACLTLAREAARTRRPPPPPLPPSPPQKRLPLNISLKVACLGDGLTQGDHNPFGKVRTFVPVLEGLLRAHAARRDATPCSQDPSLCARVRQCGGAHACADTAPTTVRAVNFGLGGRTAGRWGDCEPRWWRSPETEAQYHYMALSTGWRPHVLLLMFGTDDVRLAGCWHREAFARGLYEIAAPFLALPTPPMIVLAIPPPIIPKPDNRTQEQASADLAAAGCVRMHACPARTRVGGLRHQNNQ